MTKTTETYTLNTSGGNQSQCTIFIQIDDAYSSGDYNFQVDVTQILDPSDNVLLNEDFTDAVTMLVTGTTHDYGYISTDQITIGGWRVEGRGFKKTKF